MTAATRKFFVRDNRMYGAKRVVEAATPEEAVEAFYNAHPRHKLYAVLTTERECRTWISASEQGGAGWGRKEWFNFESFA